MLSVRLQMDFLTRVMRSPEAVARLLAGAEEVTDGQAVPLRTRLMLRTIALDPRPRHTLSVARQRADFGALSAAGGGKLCAVEVSDHAISESLRVRIYRPRGTQELALPALLYLHGGGFVIGSVETHDAFTRRVADQAQCVVASLEYRLAPEHVFPAAVDDTLEGWRWLTENAKELGLDPERMAVGGDSAGGNLAAVLCQVAADAGLACPALQWLIYPAVTSCGDHPSRRKFADGFLLSAAHVDWYMSTYTGGVPRHDDTRLSPLRAAHVGTLPRTVIVVAGLDPLHDEGSEYAEKLAAAGVGVEVLDMPGMIHGFITLPGFLPEADAAIDVIITAFSSALG